VIKHIAYTGDSFELVNNNNNSNNNNDNNNNNSRIFIQDNPSVQSTIINGVLQLVRLVGGQGFCLAISNLCAMLMLVEQWGKKVKRNPVHHFARLACRNFFGGAVSPRFCFFLHYGAWYQAMTTQENVKSLAICPFSLTTCY